MNVTIDNPETVAAPVGHYSHVARVEGSGTLLTLSGQVACDAGRNVIGPGDMTAQSESIFGTIGAILTAHGATFDDVVNIRSYLTDLDMIGEYIAVRKKYLTGQPPTSTTIEVPRLFLPEALLEVEIVAAVSS